MVSKWKFWTWPQAMAALVDRYDVLDERLADIEEELERVETFESEVRIQAVKITKIENTRQDHAIRTTALERRFDRLEELIKKSNESLKLGADLEEVGKDFYRRFLADGQRYLVEYEDLLKKWQPR